MQVETMRMHPGNGPSMTPHIVASHGIAVKQEPSDERLRPFFSAAGGRAIPPLPTRVGTYRIPGSLPSTMPYTPPARTDAQPIAQGGRPVAHASATTIKVETPLPNVKTRICAAMNCVFMLPMDYPHLRCRNCRAQNIPRRPELSTILTPAQMLARDRRYQGIPPLPPRVGSTMPFGSGPSPGISQYQPPPPLPTPIQLSHGPQKAPRPTLVIPTSPSPFYSVPPSAPCKSDPDEADRALQALLKPSPDDDADDTDTVDLTYPEELSYPESGNATPVEVKPPPLPSTITDAPSLPPAISPATQPAHKRRKVSHSDAIDPLESSNANSASQPSQPPIPPLPSRSSIKSHPPAPPPLATRRPLLSQPNAAASTSTAKPCSEANCQNHIPAASPVARCMSCISKAWKSKRLPSTAVTKESQSPSKDGRRRGVTWADKHDREHEHDEFDLRKALQDHEDEATDSDSPESRPLGNLPQTPTDESGIEGWDSDLTELSQSDSGGETSDDEDKDDAGDEEPEVPSTPVRTGLKIRLPPLSARKQEDVSSPLVEPTPPSPTPTSSLDETVTDRAPPTSSPTPTPDDRDTSSIAHSTPTTTPDVEPEYLQESDRSSSPKKCAHPRCKHTLPPNYHWKTCVVCRASARGYQRKRQNLQGRHMQLDLELEEHLKEHPLSGGEDDKTPPPVQTTVRLLLSGSRVQGGEVKQGPKPPPLKIEMEPFDDDDTSYRLIPGSRICSVKDCSHVVPPAEEYPWKLCMKCRARSKENNKQRAGRASLPVDSSVKEYRHEIVGAKALAMKRPDGRCLSLDCGMLVGPASKYPYCRQCRLQDWRLKRRDLRKQAILEAEEAARPKTPSSSSSGSSTPLSIRIPAMRNRVKLSRAPIQPRPPTPYPEYKNLAALLTNFRRLAKNFFDAQTMHFAHQSPSSAPSLSIFIFDGEFTLVAPDLLVAQKRKAQVEKTVAMIQREVGTAARLQYEGKKWLTTFKDGIVTRFVCWRVPVTVRVPVPVEVARNSSGYKQETPSQGGGQEDAVPSAAQGGEDGNEEEDHREESSKEQADKPEPAKYLLKEVLSYHQVMEGEVEVAVFADRSHPFIPGERTVVRVRLVG